MGEFMNKVLNFMGIGDVEEGEEEVIVEDKKEEFFTPEPRPRYSERDFGSSHTPSHSGRKSKVVNIHATTQLKVVVLQPTTYNDATEIAGHLKDKKPVVVNLEKLDKETARKIVDFLSGAVYALDGSMQKVSNGILLLVPYTMGIMGDFSDEIKTHALFDFF
ncbi:MAG: cell division protein SepF [Clostridia bacterium]|nr:cell division protein SepF [Clostridia bacterium]